MRKNPAPIEENRDLEVTGAPVPDDAAAEGAGSGDPGTLAAPAPPPPMPRRDAAPVKPGLRKITLAQARAHHAKA